MKCPRCGAEYERYEILRYPGTDAQFYCNGCDTYITLEVTQAMVNRMWVTMDQGFVHEEAKCTK